LFAERKVGEQHGPAAQGVLAAVQTLREMNADNLRKVPADAPTAFIKPRWKPLVITPEGLDRKFYEICALSELKNALRSGDIWVKGSRQFRDFDDYLLPAEKFAALKREQALPLAINPNSDQYLEERLQLLDEQLATVTASLMLRKLGSYPRQNGLAVALRELGRIERTLFILDWLQSVELRRRVHAGLNKGEARNSLARAVFFNRLGEIRDRSFEQQRYRASGLNLVTAAIVLWNTVYLERATQGLVEAGKPVDGELLQFLSPLGWEHINLTGDYVWRQSRRLEDGKFRPLRMPGKP
ncbi:transposase, partial [Escherichia coli]|nr:transposase [Escherichia coli]